MLTVRRDRGLFGTVNVQWAVEAAGSNDLSPTSGVITFAPVRSIQSTLCDQVVGIVLFIECLSASH